MAGRLRSFSDGVFSIVLTLLVLSLALPAGRLATDADLLAVLVPLAPKFAGYLISFLLVGLFWMIHVRIDRAMLGADRVILAVNLVSLFPITILPFATDVLTRSLKGRLAWALYAGNITLAALGTILLWVFVVRRGFADPAQRSGAFRLIPIRSAVLAGTFLLSIPATYVDPVAGRYVAILFPVAFRLLGRTRALKESVESDHF